MRGIGEVLTSFFLDSKAFHKMRMKATLAPANHHLITQDRIDSVHRPLAAADAHRSVLATSRSWDACRIQDDAQYINQPTLIIWGEQDNVIPIQNGERLFDSILEFALRRLQRLRSRSAGRKSRTFCWSGFRILSRPERKNRRS